MLILFIAAQCSNSHRAELVDFERPSPVRVCGVCRDEEIEENERERERRKVKRDVEPSFSLVLFSLSLSIHSSYYARRKI